MAFWVPLLRPVLCCSGLSRAFFLRPSFWCSVASASAAAAAGCSDRFGFTSRDGSVAAPGGAESRPFSAGRVGCGSFCPGFRFRVSVPALVLAMVSAAVVALVPAAVPLPGVGGAGLYHGLHHQR